MKQLKPIKNTSNISKEKKRSGRRLNYNFEYVKKEAPQLLNRLLENEDIIFKGELVEDRPYTTAELARWRKRFKDSRLINDCLDKISEVLETRINTQGLRKKLNPELVKFNLINSHGWRDKTEHTNTSEIGSKLAQLFAQASEKRKLDKVDPKRNIKPYKRIQDAVVITPPQSSQDG